ncbi:MAG: hypothetical protein N4J56_004148 [Chroococcidiopsis sp. SAG 2025]|nr:hypothetical protein [Chroococcidiopsis sp. SAG 2025]
MIFLKDAPDGITGWLEHRFIDPTSLSVVRASV